VPKKAVAIFFLLAFLGAAIFVFLTFPRTKDQIPTSNNQRPFPSAPAPSPTVPNTVPVPETVPHPTPPKVPPGPTLHVMAWASGPEVAALQSEADAFGDGTGRRVALTIDSDLAGYRRDLQQAVASGSPPDLCLVDARDYSGLDPVRDLVDLPTPKETPARCLAAFTVNGKLRAVPDEFAVDVLFYNLSHFDQAGIGYPGPHWNWDILEADARAIESLKLKDNSGQVVYPLELPADFDFWNVLCTQAGHPAMDLGVWHLADVNTKESQMRALGFIHDVFQQLTVAAPLPKAGEEPGRYFAQQRASLLIAPSSITATLPAFNYAFTLLPEDMERASLAQINGWAVTAKSADPEAAHALAVYLAFQPVHAGWTSIRKPVDDSSRDGVCFQALDHALIPQIKPRSASMAHYLDQQINLLARNSQQRTDEVYDRIQIAYQNEMPESANEAHLPSGPKPTPKIEAAPQLRGL
jgi:ABC-type glycerol-3-phosphate transport system substrate-binding protein